MSDILRRSLAPITTEAWAEIDDEARRVLKPYLSGRSIVDFSGPHGWTKAGVNVGRVEPAAEEPIPGVTWGTRQLQPLLEIRVPFVLNIWELDNVSRGADDADLEPLGEAARKAAQFEDHMIYNGFSGGSVKGIIEASPHEPTALPDDVQAYPEAVAMAIEKLQLAGIDGPYALVLEPGRYHKLVQSTKTGYPLFRVIERMVGGKVRWSSAVTGGVLISERGEDYELTVGVDMSVGYNSHTKEEVELFFTESLTFRVIEPAAALQLKP
jgi:uncharacterized linocin/CFP29 family protein